MEIITYIENHTQITLPTFKHPTKTILSNIQKSQHLQQQNLEIVYSQNVTIPDRIILNTMSTIIQNQMEETIKYYLLFGYQFRLKDWEILKNIYEINVNIKLFRGNQVTEIAPNLCPRKSNSKNQKINEQNTLIKRDQKLLESQAQIYTVQVTPIEPPYYKKLIYYLPSILDKKSKDYPLECIKYRYFNHKMLQILNQYVSLQNNSTSCYKDRAHHQFQTMLYSGKVVSFQIFLKLVADVCSQQITESFVQKLTQISMTDKHLLDQVDPFDFSEIKKQIRNYYFQQKRLRTSLTFQKLRIVEQIQSALQFFNLKYLYPKKLTYSCITNDMLKKIRNQNLQNKSIWIKQQNIIIKHLQIRAIELQKLKQKYKYKLLEQQKNNYQIIQNIRNQIKALQKFNKYQKTQQDKNNNTTKDKKQQQYTCRKVSMHNIENNISPKNNLKQTNKQNSTIFNKTIMTNAKKIQTITSKSKSKQLSSIMLNKLKNNNDTIKYKKQLELELEQLQKQKILKFQMIKAEFEMEKQFVRRKIQYTKATEDLVNNLVDC